MSAETKLTAARTTLVLGSPFFGALALRLKLVPDPSCDTAWTDGVSIGYNPAFIDSLTQPELTGLLAHEVLHVANGHCWRRDGRDSRQWNVAADYAINGALVDAKFSLPEDGLLDPQYTGKSAEWIYARLPQDPPPPESPEDEGEGEGEDEDEGESGQGDGAEAPEDGSQDTPQAAGEVRDAPEDEDAPSEAEWQQAVREASQLAGSVGGDLERHIEAATAARVDWRSILRRFVSETARADYTWTRPSPRYVASGMYLPALHSEALPPVVFGVDTSCSMDKLALSQCAAELDAAISEAQPSRVHVMYCDTAVRSCDTFEQGEPLTVTPKGGGGTDFRPLFEAVKDLPEPPCCVIYFTDLYGPFPTEEPPYPVLWAATSDKVAPFGETVRLER
jgi:predicted metal-dependent peptidase